MNPPKYIVEACAQSLDSALAGQAGGADRIELCAGLIEGGTTPSAATIRMTRRKVRIALNVLVRPRAGDFLYGDNEFATMLADIDYCKECGVDGVVIGMLNADGTVDAARTAYLIAAARPMSVTFHRAFDMTRDPIEALDCLIHLGVDRLLTSGLAADAPSGADCLRKLVEHAAGRIAIMPGAGVNAANVRQLRDHTGACEFHLSGQRPTPSGMKFRNPNAHFAAPGQDAWVTYQTHADSIRAVVDALATP